MGNSGYQEDAATAEALFVKNFKQFDYIVGPSGSCVHHIRAHFDAIPQTKEVMKLRAATYELVAAVGPAEARPRGASHPGMRGAARARSAIKGRQREASDAPEGTFRAWYLKNRGGR